MRNSIEHTTWVLVADGSRARVFQYCDRGRDLQVIDDGYFEHPNLPSRDIAQEKRGRVFHSADGSRSAMERPSDPHQFEKQRFAGRLANFLQKKIEDNQFDRLIVVAPPKVLGYLRQEFSPKIAAVVSSEIDKDLTNIKPRELSKHLTSVLNSNA